MAGATASRAGQLPGLRTAATFRLERFLARGPHTKIVALWGLLLLLSIVGGLLAWLTPALEFHSLREAMWWAFLRLSDPGYLAQDAAPGLRMLSIGLTMVGLALFVGVLVAILTQWFTERMDHLALGLTPVTFTGHVAILGWTNRTLELAAALLESRGTPPRVVILVERITAEFEQRLRDRLPKRLRSRVVLRSGDPEQPDDLARVLGRGPEAVVVPAADRPGRDADHEDPRTLKILATLEHAMGPADSRPLAIVELAEPGRGVIAHQAYGGPLYAVPTQTLVGRSLALGILAPGLCSMFTDIVDDRSGCTLRVERHPGLAGERLGAASARFARGTVLGALRAGGGAVSVGADERLREDDRLLMLAPVGETLVPDGPPLAAEEETTRARPLLSGVEERHVLLLGWSGKVPAMCRELTLQRELRCRVDVVSQVEPAVRETALPVGYEAGGIRHLVGDTTSPEVLDLVELADYDCVVLVGSDDAADAAEADSRTVAAVLLLRHLLSGSVRRPHVIAELLDAANAPVVADFGVELLITPDFLAGVLAGAVRQPELGEVLERMMQGRLGRIGVVPLCRLVGKEETSFGAVEQRVRGLGLIWLGAQRESRGFALELAPDKRERLRAGERDVAVVVRPDLPRAPGAPEGTRR